MLNDLLINLKSSNTHKFMTNIKKGSNKEFGIVFSIVFFFIFTFIFFKNGQINYSLLFISFIFFILGLINSSLLTPLNKIWFKVGLFLGKIISPVIMGIIFFAVVTPIAIIMRILKGDLLNIKFHNKKTYWQIKDKPKSTMRNQF